jgi:hypothetical protein
LPPWRALAIPLAGLAGDLVGRLADVASTLALFAMGMSLRRHLAAGLALGLLKLLGHASAGFAARAARRSRA